ARLTPAVGPTAAEATKAPGPLAAAQPFWQSDGLASWLSSLAFHTLLLILLMLWQLAPGQRGWQLTFSQSDPNHSSPERLERLVLPQEPQLQATAQDAAEAQAVDLGNAAPAAVAAPQLDLLPDLLTHRRDAGGREQLEALLSASASQSRSEHLLGLPSGGMAPRTAASRAELGARYGATPESENAVELALAWLAEHQQRDGSWSFDLTADPCRGRCSHSRTAGDHATPSTAG